MTNEEVYLNLCKKYNKPMYVIKAICKSPFFFVRDEVKIGSKKNIKFDGLGKFCIKPYMFKKYNLRILEIEEILQNERKAKGDSPGLV